MIEMSVVTYTVREKGLEFMARYLAAQTYPKDKFEWIVVDGFYHERSDFRVLCKELGLHLIHLPETDVGYKFVGYNIASNGNWALAHVTTPNLVIIDDHHIFPQNLLEAHLHYLKLGYSSIPQWTHVDYMIPSGYEYDDYESFIRSEVVPRLHEADPRAKGLKGLQPGQVVVDCPAAWWWPNSTGVPFDYILKCGGYDTRHDGGTGGTDNDLAARMATAGLKYVFVPDLQVYHIDTSRFPVRVIPGLCDRGHDRAPFTYNQYTKGDPNLVENEYLRTFVEDGVKYFVCKECDGCGIIDSQDVLKSNMRNHRTVPPSFAAGHDRARLLDTREELRHAGYSHSTKCVTCK